MFGHHCNYSTQPFTNKLLILFPFLRSATSFKVSGKIPPEHFKFPKKKHKCQPGRIVRMLVIITGNSRVVPLTFSDFHVCLQICLIKIIVVSDKTVNLVLTYYVLCHYSVQTLPRKYLFNIFLFN